MRYNFEWDPVKAQLNLKKHRIRFEEAAEIFLDPLHVTIPDNDHNEIEERWITLGQTRGQKLILIVHTFVSNGEYEVISIRIISARPATAHERQQYEEL